MANWFNRIKLGAKRAAKPDINSASRLARDYRPARDVVAGLTVLDSVGDLAVVTSALQVLTENGYVLLEDRFDEIHALDSAGEPRLFEMIREYLAAARPKKARERELWKGAYGYLQELYRAYQFCLQRYESDLQGSLHFRPKLPIATARALRALRLQLKWALLRYSTPEQTLWRDMAGLYTFALSHGIAEDQVPFYPGRKITVREEFVKGLMIASCSNDTLRPAELDLATRLADYYAQHFVLADQPFEGCTHWFDLRDPRLPLRKTKAPPQDNTVRYLGAGAALADLRAVRAEMARTGVVPHALRFYEKQNDQLLMEALAHLELDWAGKTQARGGERKKGHSRVTVVPGFTDILRALDFAVNDSLDFTDQPTAESWVVEDISAGGYGAVIPAIAGDWVEVGSLVGIEGKSIHEWRIGVIRRVNRLEGDQQRVGVQLLGTGAELVTLSHKTDSYEPAIMLTEESDGLEVLVASGVFANRGHIEVVLRNKRLHLKQVEVVERNAHTERVALKFV